MTEEKKTARRNPALVFGVWLASVAALFCAFRVHRLAYGNVPYAEVWSLAMVFGVAWMASRVCDWIVEGTWKTGKPATAKTLKSLMLFLATIAVAIGVSEITR